MTSNSCNIITVYRELDNCWRGSSVAATYFVKIKVSVFAGCQETGEKPAQEATIKPMPPQDRVSSRHYTDEILYQSLRAHRSGTTLNVNTLQYVHRAVVITRDFSTL